MKNYSVFVINISDKRWEKYSQDKNNIYNRFLANTPNVRNKTLFIREETSWYFVAFLF